MKIIKIALQSFVLILMTALFLRGILFIVNPSKDNDIPSSDKLIAVVDFKGVILEADTLYNIFKKLEDNSDVKGYILRINSGGGLVAPSQQIYEDLLKLKKPLYVAMGSAAASGGYMISLPANKIYAMPSSITGSIGVIMELVNYEGLYNKIGMKASVIKSGKYKDSGNPGRPMTEDDRRVLNVVVMDMYEQFVQAVSSRRGMTPENVKRLADGRIYTGKIAKELGLVDELGSWYDAFTGMKNDLNMPDAEYFIYKSEELSQWKKMLSEFKGVFSETNLMPVAMKPSGFYFLSEY